MLRQEYMSLKLLDEIFRCCHSNETTPADQLHWFICLVGFIFTYLLIYIYIYIYIYIFIYLSIYITRDSEKGDSWKIRESLHLSEFPDRSFTVSFQNDYMCGVCAPRTGMAFTPSLFLADLGFSPLCGAFGSRPALITRTERVNLFLGWIW